jgi:hypothetical protein
MAGEFVVLSQTAPGRERVIAALAATDPSLRVDQREAGGPMTLYDEQGEAVFSVSTPLLVRNHGEAIRLLGIPDEPDPPYWWIEIHTADGASTAPAARFADALCASPGGVCWTSG